jgi:hypothetical protein
MAIDSHQKRRSALSSVARGVVWIALPLADSSIDTGDRAHMNGMYSGISAAAPATLERYRQGTLVQHVQLSAGDTISVFAKIIEGDSAQYVAGASGITITGPLRQRT